MTFKYYLLIKSEVDFSSRLTDVCVSLSLKDDSHTLIVYRPVGTHALIIIVIIQFSFLKSMELLAYSDDIALSFTGRLEKINK